MCYFSVVRYYRLCIISVTYLQNGSGIPIDCKIFVNYFKILEEFMIFPSYNKYCICTNFYLESIKIEHENNHLYNDSHSSHVLDRLEYFSNC